MDCAHISELLGPFLGPATATESQLADISIYIDLLLRWNARVNLTSVRQPEEIVTRHFGESLFAGRHLFPQSKGNEATGVLAPPSRSPRGQQTGGLSPSRRQAELNPDVSDLLDLGSGAGFPGLPIKIWNPSLRVTLVESNQKKATFLREAIRALTFTDINVFPGRAQDFVGKAATVTLRAVEHFEAAVPVAASLVAPCGRLALLVSLSQVESVRRLAPRFNWQEPVSIPLSNTRILAVGALRDP